MKNDIEIASAVAGGIGAVLKGLKSKIKLKSLIINAFVGLFLGFGVIQGLVFFFSSHKLSIGLIAFIGWLAGWLSNEITDKMEAYIDVVYEITVDKTKEFFNNLSKWFKPKK